MAAFKVKLTGPDPEVRRFVLDEDVSTSFSHLKGKLAELFFAKFDENRDFVVSWFDNDGDEVIIGSDEELVIALTEMTGSVYKIYAKMIDKPKVNGKADGGNSIGKVHSGVICDGCDSGISGFRYKCVTCTNYDLCGKCDTKGVHSEHNMMRLVSPDVTWPRHFFNRLNRFHDRASKRSANENRDAGLTIVGSRPGNVTIRGNRPKSVTIGGNRPGTKRGDVRTILPTIVSGWTGEGVSCDSYFNQSWMMDGEGNNNPRSFGPKNPQDIPSPPKSGKEFLRTLGGYVASALDPFGVDVHVDIETQDGQRTCVKPDASQAKANAPQEKDNGPQEKDNGPQEKVNGLQEKASAPQEKANGPQEKASAPQENASAPQEKANGPQEKTSAPQEKDNGPQEKANGPQEKDNGPQEKANGPQEKASAPQEKANGSQEKANGSQEKANSPQEKASVPQEKANKDFDGADSDIDEEWQVCGNASPEPVVVNIPVEVEKNEESAALYPELKEVLTVARHANPKIQVALQAMMNMGFTDEGGWLTQLLENKDGDIGKVLDVMQPSKAFIK